MMEIKILYEDCYLTVAEKPSGVLSEGSDPSGMPSLLASALGVPHLSVHRLDRETSGVMVYAKDGKTAGALSALLKEGRFRKEYLAVVHGAPADESGHLEDLLYRDAKRNKSYLVDRPRKGVRSASLSYRVEGSIEHEGQRLSLLSITLGTGRTHQIRVQFSGRGMPLYGDGRYGGRERDGFGLLAKRLSFPHPVTQKLLSFEAKTPEAVPFSLFS